jgi:putative aminopeptidase FrvX
MRDYLDPHKQGHAETHTMSPERLDRLKDVLSIPSSYRQETMATAFIVKFCTTHGFTYVVDKLGSVLITKGELAEGEFYPMIGAHMDTVHFPVTKIIREHNNILTAWDTHGHQVGIGGDDLAGVAICCELLLKLPVLKVGLFIGEEVGCVGSRNAVADFHEWFRDVGYMIEFDGPEDYMITQVCSGVELFDPEGEFITKSVPLLQESMGEKMRFFQHPYTDVSVIKNAFSFSCINISAGYFNYHSSKEYVVISEVEKAIVLGEKMIAELQFKRYDFTPEEKFDYHDFKRVYNPLQNLFS